MQRIVLGVEYDGSAYAGWQFQVNSPSIQQALERALSRVADKVIVVHCAGRTDRGVHALEQVVHFDTDVDRPLHAWVLGSNSHLPDDVRVLWAKPAVDDFHARYSAIARFYRYRIYNRPVNSAINVKHMTWCPYALDAGTMHRAAQYLIGNHDFSSFRAQGCQSRSPWRYMHWIDVYQESEQIVIDIAANAFLHHMVRNIAGALMEIGVGRRSEDWIKQLMAEKNRQMAGATAPPEGLYLAGVFYPRKFGMDMHPVFAKLPIEAHRFVDNSE